MVTLNCSYCRAQDEKQFSSKQDRDLSADLSVRIIKKSLKILREVLAEKSAPMHLKKPKVYLSFDSCAGEIIPFFPSENRLNCEYKIKDSGKAKIKIMSMPCSEVPMFVWRIVGAVKRIIELHSQLDLMKARISKQSIHGFLRDNTPGTAIPMDLEYEGVETWSQKRYFRGERVIFCYKGRDVVAKVKRVLLENGEIFFSLGNGREKSVPIADLDGDDHPVFWRELSSNTTETMGYYPWKLKADLFGLEEMSNEEILEVWSAQTNL